MNNLQELDISNLLEGVYRRKGVVVAFFLVIFILGVYLAYRLPNVYRSGTLILLSPQRIPTAFVSSTITSNLSDRVYTISQQILSRSRLEKIISEFNLYSPGAPGVTMEDRVESFRRNIGLDVRRYDAFQISYEAGDPELAMKVAGRLTSLFIEENLRAREEQTISTKTFINSEAERLRQDLEEQERRVSTYSIENRFELPGQLDANLRMIEQLRGERNNSRNLLASLQERKANLEKQIAESEIIAPDPTKGRISVNRPNFEIQVRKKELEALRLRYSDKHPDIIRLKNVIEILESKIAAEPSGTEVPFGDSAANALRDALVKQLSDVSAQIQSLQAREEALRGSIDAYQTRVENTPIRSVELNRIGRTYDITLGKFRDLLGKGLESQLAENMEKKEKGEKFQVVDPPNFPIRPIRPNRQYIIMIGLLGGLACGIGLALLLEVLDSSFKKSEEVSPYVNLPVLATLPALVTRGSVLEQRRLQVWVTLASGGVLALGLVFIRFFGARFF